MALPDASETVRPRDANCSYRHLLPARKCSGNATGFFWHRLAGILPLWAGLGSPWTGHRLPPKALTLKSLGSSEEEEEEASWGQGCTWGVQSNVPSHPWRARGGRCQGITVGVAFSRVPCPPHLAWGNDLQTPTLGCRGWEGALCSPGTYQRPGNKFF